MCLALIAAALLHQTTTLQYEMLLEGKKAGEATLVQTRKEDRSKTVQLEMGFQTRDGRKVTVVTEGSYDPKGRAIRRSQRVESTSPNYLREVTATFNPRGANVVVFEDGKRSVKNVSLVPTAPTESPSELWFSAYRPGIGTSAQTYVLNLDTLVWEPVRTTYAGPAKVVVQGKTLEAHRLNSDKGVAYLDDEGLPLVFELVPFRLERVK